MVGAEDAVVGRMPRRRVASLLEICFQTDSEEKVDCDLQAFNIQIGLRQNPARKILHHLLPHVPEPFYLQSMSQLLVNIHGFPGRQAGRSITRLVKPRDRTDTCQAWEHEAEGTAASQGYDAVPRPSLGPPTLLVTLSNPQCPWFPVAEES